MTSGGMTSGGVRGAGAGSGPSGPEDAEGARRPRGGASAHGRRIGEGFGRLLGVNYSSSLADGIARTAAPLLALRLTDDPLLIAGVAAVVMLPWLLFALPAGMFIDRFDRRRVMTIASGGRAGLAAALFALVLTHSLTIWWLYAILFLYGIGETLADGSVRAVVPSLVPRENLARANGRIEAGEQVLQGFVAAPFTSVLFAVSALIPLGVNAAGFAIAAGLAFRLPRVASGRARTPERERLGVRLRAGLRFLLGNRMLLLLWLYSTFWALCLSMGTSLVPLYALGRLGLPESLFGVLLLTEAVGGVLTAVFVERLRRRFGTGPTMAVASVLVSLSLLFVWAVPQLWALALALFVNGGAILVWNVLSMSLRQAVIPEHLLGRVHGTWRTLHWGAIPLGSLLGGLLGRIDVTLPFLVGGALTTLAGLVLFPKFARLPEPDDL